jgi:hypothetical protein
MFDDGSNIFGSIKYKNGGLVRVGVRISRVDTETVRDFFPLDVSSSSSMVRERIGGCLVGVSFRGMLPTFMVNQLLLNLNASWFDIKMHYAIS